MRNFVAICALGAWVFLAGGVRAQIPPAPALAGTITLVDTNRELIVIQEHGQARAVKLEGALPKLQVGERVVIEGDVAPYYTGFPDYPDHPSGAEVLDAFQAPRDSENHFLARLRGFLQVPADGNYTFWVAADDEAELSLGASSDAGTAKQIAVVSNATRQDEWDRDAGQKSRPVFLKAGERYYIEAKQREWRGRDHLSVAWQGPGFGRRIIAGEFFSPWRTDNGVTNGLLREYWTNCFITRLAVLSPKLQDASVVKASAARVKSLGVGEMPAPRRLRLDQTWTEDVKFLYVEVEGVASFVARENGQLTLELTESNGRRADPAAPMTVRVFDAENLATEPLINRKVRVRGVCERVLNERGEAAGGQLWVQGAAQLTVLEFSESDARKLEVLPMFDLTPANLNLAWGRKVAVRGTVIENDAKAGTVTLRGDDSFYAYSSEDGITWNLVGVPVPVAMNDSIYVGLVASSVTNAGGAEAVFNHVSASLKPSDSVGLGKISTEGGVVFTNSSIILRPHGGNDWVSADEGLFIYQRLEAEGEIVAQLSGFKSTRISDKAGLMMRDSLNADAPYVALVMTHGTRLDLLYRASRRAFSKAVNRGASEVPRWMKLVRQQHSLTAHLMAGEKIRVRQYVELVGLLQWQEEKPVLTEAYVRSTKRPEQTPPTLVETRESRIADLPSETAESEQYVGENYLIRGVVTFIGRAFGRDLLFLQDESGAASIRAAPAFLRVNEIQPGQLLEAKGDVQFAPGVAPFRLNTGTVLGWGAMPRPVAYPLRAAAKQADNYWVEAKGVVRSVTNNFMNVMALDGLVSVWVGGLGTSNELARYVDCLVTVRGVFTLQVALEPMLLVPSSQFIEVTEYPPENPFLVPSHGINKVCASDLSPSRLHRTKVTGVVTYRDENTLVLQDQTGGARVFGSPTSDIQIGDRVEAVGFPELVGRAVTLHESVLRKVAGGHLPAPVEMMLEGMLDGRLNCWLVRLEGILLDQKTRQGRQLLELQNGQRVFEAVLAEAAGQLKPLPIGSRVQVTGVTQLQLASNNSDTAMRREYPLVATMDILMRTPADLVLLERPPWWTWRHTASVGALLLVVLAGAVGWIRALRRRVAQRTNELQVAMGRLQKETELSATLAERERLAAEIHDTLEQGLSGIMMQLDGIDSRMAKDDSGARENLEMARRMVRFSRAEVRHSLWNLESQLLKDGDLGAAIREIVRQMVAGCSTAVTVNVSATTFTLPAAVEHHLLRCSQEALSNALKHSRAANIRVTLNYNAQQVELKVEDDGCGFDPGLVMTGAGTHLGLRNLRSRARKMKGRLDVASQPGQGTTICLTVPLNERTEKNSPSTQ